MASPRDPSPDALALLDAAACGLLQTADDGTIVRANRMFCSWLGYSAEELVGRRRFQDLLTMGGRIFHQTHWVPLLRMQGSISEVKLEVVHRDGTTFPMVVNAIRHEQDGVVIHELAAFVARDRDKYERELVLSRKRLEELVAEATRLQAEAKDRALFAEQMVGIVSHDLRNPLSGIAMGTALLARGRPLREPTAHPEPDHPRDHPRESPDRRPARLHPGAAGKRPHRCAPRDRPTRGDLGDRR